MLRRWGRFRVGAIHESPAVLCGRESAGRRGVGHYGEDAPSPVKSFPQRGKASCPDLARGARQMREKVTKATAPGSERKTCALPHRPLRGSFPRWGKHKAVCRGRRPSRRRTDEHTAAWLAPPTGGESCPEGTERGRPSGSLPHPMPGLRGTRRDTSPGGGGKAGRRAPLGATGERERLGADSLIVIVRGRLVCSGRPQGSPLW